MPPCGHAFRLLSRGQSGSGPKPAQIWSSTNLRAFDATVPSGALCVSGAERAWPPVLCLTIPAVAERVRMWWAPTLPEAPCQSEPGARLATAGLKLELRAQLPG